MLRLTSIRNFILLPKKCSGQTGLARMAPMPMMLAFKETKLYENLTYVCSTCSPQLLQRQEYTPCTPDNKNIYTIQLTSVELAHVCPKLTSILWTCIYSSLAPRSSLCPVFERLQFLHTASDQKQDGGKARE